MGWNKKLISPSDTNFGFLTTISHLLDMAQRANQLFTDTDITTKNKLPRFVPANSTLYGKVLSCRLNNTYEVLASLNRKAPKGPIDTNWCA